MTLFLLRDNDRIASVPDSAARRTPWTSRGPLAQVLDQETQHAIDGFAGRLAVAVD